MIRYGVILAGGLGSRLDSEERNEPKPLMTVGGTALLERVILLMKNAGIKQIVIVLGYRSGQIIKFLNDKKFKGIVTVTNNLYYKKNGISLLKSRDALKTEEPFLLSMADHVFSDDFFSEFIKRSSPFINSSSAVLSVDRNINDVFDLDDATKVLIKGHNIVKIGKDLNLYNAIDTGLFLCSHSIFGFLERAYLSSGDVSISDGMKALAGSNRFFAADMTGYVWQDVDTPEMKKEAEKRLLNNAVTAEKNK